MELLEKRPAMRPFWHRTRPTSRHFALSVSLSLYLSASHIRCWLAGTNLNTTVERFARQYARCRVAKPIKN